MLNALLRFWMWRRVTHVHVRRTTRLFLYGQSSLEERRNSYVGPVSEEAATPGMHFPEDHSLRQSGNG